MNQKLVLAKNLEPKGYPVKNPNPNKTSLPVTNINVAQSQGRSSTRNHAIDPLLHLSLSPHHLRNLDVPTIYSHSPDLTQLRLEKFVYMLKPIYFGHFQVKEYRLCFKYNQAIDFPIYY